MYKLYNALFCSKLLQDKPTSYRMRSKLLNLAFLSSSHTLFSPRILHPQYSAFHLEETTRTCCIICLHYSTCLSDKDILTLLRECPASIFLLKRNDKETIKVHKYKLFMLFFILCFSMIPTFSRLCNFSDRIHECISQGQSAGH